MKGDISADYFHENQSMYLEIAKKQFNGEEYKLAKKQFIESRFPHSEKYNELISKQISKIKI